MMSAPSLAVPLGPSSGKPLVSENSSCKIQQQQQQQQQQQPVEGKGDPSGATSASDMSGISTTATAAYTHHNNSILSSKSADWDASNTNSNSNRNRTLMESNQSDTTIASTHSGNVIGDTTSSKHQRDSATEMPPAQTASTRIEQLGDPETGMCLVYPPLLTESTTTTSANTAPMTTTAATDAAVVITILKEIDHHLKLEKVQTKIMNFMKQHPENDSVRIIEGERIEIFVDAIDKESTCFDEIVCAQLKTVPTAIEAKDYILNYCRLQAKMDPRLTTDKNNNKIDYEFQNFSLLVSLYRCPAQTPHIDLVLPNYQFGLFVSDGTEGTYFVEPTGQEDMHTNSLETISTPDDVIHLWETTDVFCDGQCPNVPPAVVNALKNHDAVPFLIGCFGNVLHPEQKLKARMITKKKIPVGTLASLPGSVVHAGPKTSGPRTILFFSGTPSTGTIESYMPDSQYNGPTLATQIVSCLWISDGIGTYERAYLLRLLTRYIEQTTIRDVSRLLGEGSLNSFVKKIQSKRYGKKPGSKVPYTRDEFIADSAKNPNNYFKLDILSQTTNELDVSTMRCISRDDLYENEDGVMRNVILYRRKNEDRVILRYITTEDGVVDNVSPSEYEGNREIDNYTLTMNEGVKRNALFDGSNGVLKSTDGELIELKKGKKKNTGNKRKR